MVSDCDRLELSKGSKAFAFQEWASYDGEKEEQIKKSDKIDFEMFLLMKVFMSQSFRC